MKIFDSIISAVMPKVLIITTWVARFVFYSYFFFFISAITVFIINAFSKERYEYSENVSMTQTLDDSDEIHYFYEDTDNFNAEDIHSHMATITVSTEKNFSVLIRDLLLSFIQISSWLIILYSLKCFLENIKDGDIFTPKNEQRLLLTSFCFFLIFINSIFSKLFMHRLLSENIRSYGLKYHSQWWDLGWTSLLIAFIVFILAGIFAYGRKVQEENKTFV